MTFARFYAVHVLLLPPLTMLLMAVHLILVRRHGVAPAVDDTKPTKKFYPEQVFKDTVATFLWFAVLVAMAVMVKSPAGAMTADPTDISFIPRPEWYFLFLFQMLKVFEGPLEIVGSLVIPTLAILALFLVPFIDRAKLVAIRQRTGAIALVVLAAIGWAGLTARAVATTPPSTESADAGLSKVEAWREIPAEDLAAIGYFRKDNCGNCHTLGKSGSGPDLSVSASKKPEEGLLQHFHRPSPSGPETKLTAPQLKTLATFVTKRSDKDVEAWSSAPQAAVDGAIVYDTAQCSQCHMLNGTGEQMGPPLGWVGRTSCAGLGAKAFRGSEKFSPRSIMPPSDFNTADLDRITSYLLQIPK